LAATRIGLLQTLHDVDVLIGGHDGSSAHGLCLGRNG
jgi:hypothetical protein